ncbi:MAG: hypothetical protein FGM46_01545, partial [Ferruginibacter sp.]|nr:hypothetical protein [Ferruginibacter sp.]
MLTHFTKTAGVILFILFSSGNIFAQKDNGKTENLNEQDTTVLEQLKDDVGDNIPVISLDENDGQDG